MQFFRFLRHLTVMYSIFFNDMQHPKHTSAFHDFWSKIMALIAREVKQIFLKVNGFHMKNLVVTSQTGNA